MRAAVPARTTGASGRLRIHRWAWIAAATGCFALLTVGCAHRAPVGQPTADAKPGDCHHIPTPEAMVTASDNSPTVPCTAVHNVETYLTFTYHGRYAKRTSRPLPEQLDGDIGQGCVNYDAVRNYLGAGPHDEQWGVSAWHKYPSPSEWAHSVRLIRCDLVPDSGVSGPRITQSLRNILQRKDSARFRLCYRATKPVTCDKPHDTEALAGSPTLAAGLFPDRATLEQVAAQACTTPIHDYIAGSLPADFVVKPILPTADMWTHGDRQVDCGFGPAQTGRLVTGTMRGGLS